MGEQTNIAWTDHTANAWIGCTKIGPGCDACYAEALDTKRFSKTLGAGTKTLPISHWGPDAPRYERLEAWERDVRKFNRAALKAGVRRRVFINSLSDFFDNAVPSLWRDIAWGVMRSCEDLDFQVLTKRPGNIAAMLPADWGYGYPNVWLGATVVTQEEADRDIHKLVAVRARRRFLSIEPQLELVVPNLEGIDWLICGGESGPSARPFDIDWARNLQASCYAASVAFFMKQLGARPHVGDAPIHLSHRSGADPSEWPHDIQVQEFP